MNRWAGKPYPISASCYHDGRLYIRLEGAASSVASATRQLGGEIVTDDVRFWDDLREQRHGFFNSKYTLWRVSVKSTAPLFEDSADWLFEWAGARRWTAAGIEPSRLRDYAASCGGHAMQFRHADPALELQQPLAPGLEQLHERLKLAFDPERIFNPGFLYREL
jgi:glycolate oxidase FAD binding subunit